MTDPEFLQGQANELIAQELLNEAQASINAEDDPIARGQMLAAAIDEGLSVDTGIILANLNQISDDYDGDTEEISPLEHKREILQRTLTALAEQGRFEEADALIAFVHARHPDLYLRSMLAVIKKGYGGPNDRYLHLSQKEVCDLGAMPASYIMGESTEQENLTRQQLSTLSLYLRGIAQAGIDIFKTGSEYNRMYNATVSMSHELGRNPEYSRGSYGIESYLTLYTRAYLEGGHTELAAAVKDMIQDHTLKLQACLDLLEHAEDLPRQTGLLLEAYDLQEQIAACQGACGNEACAGDENRRTAQLRMACQRVKMNAIDFDQAQEVAYGSDQEIYDPFLSAKVYLEVYKQTGEEGSRSYCMSLLNDVTERPPEVVSNLLLEIAKVDIRTRRTIPNEGEDTPQVCWEINAAFWGADRYLETALDEDMPEITGFDLDADENEDDSGPDPNAIGPISWEYGESGVREDLENCLKQRDRARVALAAMLTGQGNLYTAERLLGEIESGDEKVRGMIAVARELSH